MSSGPVLRLSIKDAQELLARLLKQSSGLSGESSTIEVIIDPVSTLSPTDVGIVIALEEEFQEIFPQIEPTAVYNNEINRYYYLFERHCSGSFSYRCVVTFIGGMGTWKAALVGDRLIQQFKPSTVVNIGIAGSMDDAVLVGDVIVAEQADDYLYASKAIQSPKVPDFDFQLSGDPFKSTPAYVAHAENMKYVYPESIKNWHGSCQVRLQTCLNPASIRKLLAKELIREQPQIHVGRIASGPIVGASDLFVNWLLERRDRKYLAIEMEAAGVMGAAHTRPTDTLIIRGISDYSDKKKALFDRIGKGGLRRYAMNNALEILWSFMDLRFLSSSPERRTIQIVNK